MKEEVVKTLKEAAPTGVGMTITASGINEFITALAGVLTIIYTGGLIYDQWQKRRWKNKVEKQTDRVIKDVNQNSKNNPQ